MESEFSHLKEIKYNSGKKIIPISGFCDQKYKLVVLTNNHWKLVLVKVYLFAKPVPNLWFQVRR